MTRQRRDVETQPLVVIGDVLLDIDVVGTAARLSPEAPVPVIDEPCETFRPGGAALAACLAARGRRPVVLIAPLARDSAADRLGALLGDRVELVALPWTGTTPVKSRLRAGNHPVARVDTGGRPGRIESIPERAVAAIAEAAAILVADYGHGTASDERIRALVSDALVEIPVAWDPHPKGPPAVPGTTLITPNERELFGFVDHPADDSLTAIRRAAAEFADQWRAGAVCVTRGSRGALLFVGQDAPRLATATAVAGTDTCGAGDSFAAAVATALSDGDLLSEAVTKAVGAAGRFVAAGGAAAFGLGEPEPAEPELDLDTKLDRVRGAGGVVVATGGCFDLLHAGHVATLEAARTLGDILVVCLNSDESVRRLKGSQRPLQPVADRARVLSALQAVDAVLVFDEDTPVEALRRIKPDVWVKGGDYSGMPLPEAAILADWGGEVLTVPYLSGRSTSEIVSLAAESVQR
ncbi:MAG TPA: PfkB family carbohydrate kinase [Propionibacteriaceae bacterium]|nr:PfkB family carbohydrate kinase [Propionibacteriaceae bacterium]